MPGVPQNRCDVVAVPAVSAYSMETQTDPNRALAQRFYYEVVAEQLGITVANGTNGRPSEMCVSVTGEYDIQFSAQPVITTGVGSLADNVQIWIVVNGTDVPNSNVKLQMNGGKDIYKVAAWNWFVPLTARACVEIYWWYYAPGETIEMVAIPPVNVTASSPALPGIPSIIVTVHFVGETGGV